jgi:hypothetical protein
MVARHYATRATAAAGLRNELFSAVSEGLMGEALEEGPERRQNRQFIALSSKGSCPANGKKKGNRRSAPKGFSWDE